MTLIDEWNYLRKIRKMNIPRQVFLDNADLYRSKSANELERNGHSRTWERVLEFDYLHGALLSQKKSMKALPENKPPKKLFGGNKPEAN